MQSASRSTALRALATPVPWAAALAWMCAGGAIAQDAPPAAPSSVLRPTLSFETDYLETRGQLGGNGNGNGREGIVVVTPGVQYISRAGRLRGSLDYSAGLIYRAGRSETSGHDIQNALNAAFLAEAVPNLAFVDVKANVSQQAISAFGQQAANTVLQPNDKNRTEVATVAVTPFVHGALGTLAEYDVRVSGGKTHSSASNGFDSTNKSANATLQSPRSAALLGWAVSASEERVDYEAQPPFDNRRLNATLTVTPVPELHLQFKGGRESIKDGVTILEERYDNTSGAGLQWTPGPRTNLSADYEKRYFGHSASVSLSHRMPRSIWSYSFTRNTTRGADANSIGAPTTLFQLLFDQQASAIPDPAAREQVVRAMLAQLGQDPNQIVTPGFQTSSLSVEQRQDLSFVWLGQRTTFTLQAFTTSIGQLVLNGSADPLTAEPVRQHGYSSTLTYQLTPQTAVILSGSRLMTFDTSTQPGNDLKSVALSLTSQLGPRTSALLGARYSVFNSLTEPYRETALTGSLSYRF